MLGTLQVKYKVGHKEVRGPKAKASLFLFILHAKIEYT